MKLSYAHDHYFFRSAGEVYSQSQFVAADWSRYLAVCQSLQVIAREKDSSHILEIDEAMMSSRDSVCFELMSNCSNFSALTYRRARYRREMISLLRGSDGVAVRLPSEIGVLAAQCAIKIGMPLCVEVVGCAWDATWNFGSVVGRLYAAYNYIRMKSIVRKACHVLYVTESFLQKRYPNRSARIVAASNVELDRAKTDIPRVRRERIIGMDECGPKIGVIASLGNRYKGIQVALAAMVAVVQVYPRATLNILGPGDISPWLRMAERLNIVENVVFHGTCSPGEAVLSWLDTMDIYIQPSLQEGLPRALIEAMSRGLPSIATHIAGIPELLTDEDMIEPNNAKALASKLVEKMGSVSWRLESSNRNVQTSLNYEREVLLAKRTDFYTDFARVCNEKQV